MRFIDEATIRVLGGHGGPGCVSFRRETFIPRGGPDGGDGGDGGDVIFVASHQLGTLQDFRFKREYKAPSGLHGSGANKAGCDGEDIRVRVPVGTVIKDTETGEILVDLSRDGEEWVACEGGRGGKGNAHFVSSTFQAPKFAQPGELGQERAITLELKLLADVGIIGFPNAGKSTLISRISAAKPKIADYPFTTLTPNLGVVAMPDFKGFVVADIPGLIEGAHRGAGLGHKFLKHIERTKLFIHLLDGTLCLGDPGNPGKLILAQYQTIRKELGLFNEKLLHKPELVVISKSDAVGEPELLERAARSLRDELNSARGRHPEPGEPLVISAVSGAGIPELLNTVHRLLEDLESQKPLARERAAIALPDSEALRSS